MAVVSSHSQIKHVLSAGREEESAPTYVANAAYSDLMSSFFPVPNLLLADGQDHKAMRRTWDQHMEQVTTDISALVSQITKAHFEPLATDSEINLYESLKTLSWKLLLATFLGFEPSELTFSTLQGLQEELLRGQFSLFPVTINTPFWQSPRKRGKDAAKKLKDLISTRLRDNDASAGPFTKTRLEGVPSEHVANHALLFTTSLAVKALAFFVDCLSSQCLLVPRRDQRFAARQDSLLVFGRSKAAIAIDRIGD